MAKFDVINPYTKEKVGSAPIATSAEIKHALESLYRKKPGLSSSGRAKVLEKLAGLLIKNKRELAELITSESGLCLKDTIHEIERVSSVASYSSWVARIIEKDTTPDYVFGQQKGKAKLRVITEPFDLVAAITPFNHPMNQVAHKVFPAIAAGVRIILKPSSKTPLSAIKLGELLLEAGLEKGTLEVITGVPAKEIVDKMITSPLVDMVTFTGGLEAGLYIAKKMANSGNALKKYVPELGGCSSIIINDDADISLAAKIALKGCFGNSGQRCTAIRRVIVVDKVAKKFIGTFINEAEKITYGNPYDGNVDMGTVISEEAAELIEKRVTLAVKDGARLLLGNKRKGALYSPTVLDTVSIDSELVAKETFGPVAPIIKAKDLDDAVRLANMTEYRLAGAVVTKSRKIAEKVSNALEVGQFNWNGIPGYRTEAAPFGGFKNSGNGEKEGAVLAACGMRRIRTFYEH